MGFVYGIAECVGLSSLLFMEKQKQADFWSYMEDVSTMFKNRLMWSTTFKVAQCPTSFKIVPITDPLQHTEGPHWDHKNSILYYVDTFQATAYRWNSKTNAVTYQKFDGRNSIGTITPIKDRDGQFIVSSDRYIYHLEWDGQENNTGVIKELFLVEPTKPKNQFNDGKADINGTLWLGTLTREPDLSVSPSGGNLYQMALCSHPSHKQYEERIAGTTISNGLCWSCNNNHFFYIDSAKKTIDKYKFDVNTGSLGEKETIFTLENYPAIEGILDGMTIDSDNNLWVATFGGSSVLKINSRTGKLLRVVPMPAKYVTSVAFGGKKLDVLYVTTSRLHLTRDEICECQSAGSVFAVYGLKAKGIVMNEVEYNAEEEPEDTTVYCSK
ncbi:regucalcin-like isoform X2 [Rhynchophorus ferrugineus]|uniref:regucalcin-like isoform X2 n=1 Tax=Rhynchophorus ferrugineus TaxID=354439 RepID=UPI003FCD25C0